MALPSRLASVHLRGTVERFLDLLHAQVPGQGATGHLTPWFAQISASRYQRYGHLVEAGNGFEGEIRSSLFKITFGMPNRLKVEWVLE